MLACSCLPSSSYLAHYIADPRKGGGAYGHAKKNTKTQKQESLSKQPLFLQEACETSWPSYVMSIYFKHQLRAMQGRIQGGERVLWVDLPPLNYVLAEH